MDTGGGHGIPRYVTLDDRVAVGFWTKASTTQFRLSKNLLSADGMHNIHKRHGE